MKLARRHPWNRHPGQLPIIAGSLIRLTVDHLPGDRDPKPVWLWSSATPRASYTRFVYPDPNGCWQIDATRWELADGNEAWIMDALDDHSRVVVAAHACPAPTTAAAQAAVHAAGQLWGLPTRILSDNGPCFGGVGRTGDFVDGLAGLGIAAIHARPFHPQTCGRIERFHQTLKRWLRTQPRAASLAELQAQLDWFVEFYNHRR